MAIQIITELDLTTGFSIPSTGADWLLPWYASISTGWHGITDPGYLDDHSIVVDGSIIISEDNRSGVFTEALSPSLKIGETGFISAYIGVSGETTGGDAYVANAGYIDASNVGIYFTARTAAEIVNSGVIDAMVGIYIAASYLSKSVEITNSGLIRADIAMSVRAEQVTVNLTASSRIIADDVALDLDTDVVTWECDVSNAGLIRSQGLAISTGLGSDSVVNSGRIVGGISLGGGDDLFRSLAGRVDGEVAGGAGDDTFYVDDTGLIVVEAGNGGFDTVYAKVSYTLASDHIELLQLTGNKNVNATGAGGSETLVGNARKNALDGGGGADWLDGGRGNDKLTGGEGADTFAMTRDTGRDVILDYLDGTDRIDLRDIGAISDFDDLVANHLQVGGGDAVIVAGADELVVIDAKRNMLDASDFIFADA